MFCTSVKHRTYQTRRCVFSLLLEESLQRSVRLLSLLCSIHCSFRIRYTPSPINSDFWIKIFWSDVFLITKCCVFARIFFILIVCFCASAETKCPKKFWVFFLWLMFCTSVKLRTYQTRRCAFSLFLEESVQLSVRLGLSLVCSIQCSFRIWYTRSPNDSDFWIKIFWSDVFLITKCRVFARIFFIFIVCFCASTETKCPKKLWVFFVTHVLYFSKTQNLSD